MNLGFKQNPFNGRVLTAFIVVAALFTSLAFAATTAEDAAKYYANAGESVEVSSFTSGGQTMYMVKLNGVESVILKKVGEEFVEVTDAELSTVADDYLKAKYDATKIEGKLQSIKDNYLFLNETARGCIEGIKSFVIRTRTTVPYIYITRAGSTTFKYARDAMLELNASYPIIQEKLDAIDEGIASMESGTATQNMEGIATGLQKINENAGTMKPTYTNISTAHAIIVTKFVATAFYVKGKKETCDLDVNVSNAIEGTVSASDPEGMRPASFIVENVARETSARKESAAQKKSAGKQEDVLVELSNEISDLNDLYAHAATSVGETGVMLDSMLTKYNELNTIYLNTKSGNVTNESVTAFESKATEVRSDIATYNTTFDEYNESIYAIYNASTYVGNTVKRYGLGDSRVADLRKELTEVKLLFKSHEDKLKNGLFSALAFKSITANATSIGFRAAELAPKESQLDLVMVGGIILLIISVIGSVLYFKKYRRPPSEGPEPMQEKEVKVRFADKISLD